MKFISLTRGKEAIVNNGDFVALSKHRWYALASGTGPIYAARKSCGKVLLMHRVLLGLQNPKRKVDHRNGNSIDNRRRNLRIATDQQNQRGFLTPRKNKTSQFRGVCWRQYSSGGCWRAKICVNQKNVNLGHFSSQQDAAAAYDRAARKYFGKFASPNFSKL